MEKIVIHCVSEKLAAIDIIGEFYHIIIMQLYINERFYTSIKEVYAGYSLKNLKYPSIKF